MFMKKYHEIYLLNRDASNYISRQEEMQAASSVSYLCSNIKYAYRKSAKTRTRKVDRL